jgi:hypothetical protein
MVSLGCIDIYRNRCADEDFKVVPGADEHVVKYGVTGSALGGHEQAPRLWSTTLVVDDKADVDAAIRRWSWDEAARDHNSVRTNDYGGVS